MQILCWQACTNWAGLQQKPDSTIRLCFSREAFASLEKHKRKKPFKTQGYKRMCKTKQIEGKGQIVGANAHGSYYLYYLFRFFPNFFSFDTFCILVFFFVFPLMGACCAQIKGFTLGCREHGSRKT